MIELRISSNFANTIQKAKIGIIFGKNFWTNNLAIYQSGNQYGIIYPNTPTINLGVPFATFGRPYYDMRCFFGLIAFTIWIGLGPVSLKFTFTGSGAAAIGGLIYNNVNSCYLYTMCVA